MSQSWPLVVVSPCLTFFFSCLHVGTRDIEADASSETMFALFPELLESTNIPFVALSSKAQRRFGVSSEVPVPIEPTLWAHTFLDDHVRANLSIIACTMLMTTQQVKSLALDRRIDAAMVCRKMSREEARMTLLKAYLSRA